MKNRKCGSAPGGDGKFVDFYKALCHGAPLEGGSGRGLTQLLEVVRYIWRTEKVEESWLVGKLFCQSRAISAIRIIGAALLCWP